MIDWFSGGFGGGASNPLLDLLKSRGVQAPRAEGPTVGYEPWFGDPTKMPGYAPEGPQPPKPLPVEEPMAEAKPVKVSEPILAEEPRAVIQPVKGVQLQPLAGLQRGGSSSIVPNMLKKTAPAPEGPVGGGGAMER